MELKKWSNSDSLEERCDFILPNGDRCYNFKVPKIERCPIHGANSLLAAQENHSIRLYKLSKYAKRVSELSDHSKLRTLNEEVALLRILLEETWNRCDDEHDIILTAGPLSDLVMKIEKVVKSCHQLENNLGNLLNKARVKQIAAEMLNSVATHLKLLNQAELEEKILELIAQDLLEGLKK